MKIAEYRLEITEREQVIDAPECTTLLTVQLQYNEIVVWALIDEDTPIVPCKFVLRTTGDTVAFTDLYIGTVQTHLVKTTYHLFQILR